MPGFVPGVHGSTTDAVERAKAARDKVTRVQHLGPLSMQGRGPDEAPKFQVVACITGRGFKVRREDMKKLFLAMRGKVFTLQNVDRCDCLYVASSVRTRV
jgi:hypothetical protein